MPHDKLCSAGRQQVAVTAVTATAACAWDKVPVDPVQCSNLGSVFCVLGCLWHPSCGFCCWDMSDRALSECLLQAQSAGLLCTRGSILPLAYSGCRPSAVQFLSLGYFFEQPQHSLKTAIKHAGGQSGRLTTLLAPFGFGIVTLLIGSLHQMINPTKRLGESIAFHQVYRSNCKLQT